MVARFHGGVKENQEKLGGREWGRTKPGIRLQREMEARRDENGTWGVPSRSFERLRRVAARLRLRLRRGSLRYRIEWTTWTGLSGQLRPDLVGNLGRITQRRIEREPIPDA